MWLLIFGTPQTHAIKDESGVIRKGWCVCGALSPGCYLAERYIWWGPEMSHADILVCDGDEQQLRQGNLSKYRRLKLCRSASSNVPTIVDLQSSIS